MGAELFIRNLLTKDLLRCIASSTKDYRHNDIGTSAFADRTLYVEDANKSLRWAYGGRLYEGRGTDVGSTSQANGSVWSTTSGELRFAYGGRAYSLFRNYFANRVSGTTLHLYSDSARSNLVASIAYASSGSTLVSSHYPTWYARLSGSGGDTYDFTITARAGYTYTVSGTYTPSQDAQYSCGCKSQGTVDVDSCTELAYNGKCDSTKSNGSCQWEGFICKRQCSYVSSGFGYYEQTEYECESTMTSSSSPASWDISTAQS
jgi:hypothetical protein